ncbi:DNA-protecting protein DprA [Patescibacteria group bacterium]|nr:MAG: DNA-protecting protein DprA [Patescibacteria group bacterium]
MVHLIRKLRVKEFPEALCEITDPPAELYLQGVLPKKDNKILCVVGSRKFSTYGKEACESIIAGLAGYPITIVSGLALGIDSIAHKAALSAGLQTLAVPGSGLDPKVLYPRSNLVLAEKILEAGGGLLSEFDPMFRATPYSFPQRNRIMAGLSHAVLIIEAELKSGTLITSKFATEYNRDVFAVPGSIFSKTSDGPHMLIRLGATPIRSSKDVLEAFGFDTQESLPFEERYADASTDEMKVITLLASPSSKGDLLHSLDMPIRDANTLLSMMEIKGMILDRGGEIRLI